MKKIITALFFMTGCSTVSAPKAEVATSPDVSTVTDVAVSTDVTNATDVAAATDVDVGPGDVAPTGLDVDPILPPRASVEVTLPTVPVQATEWLDASMPEATCCPCK